MQYRKLQDLKNPDMGNDLKQWMQYIKDHPIRIDDNSGQQVLDGLYWLYSESHTMSDAGTKAAAQTLHDRLNNLSDEESDDIFSLAISLCAEHERLAFQVGPQVGAQLVMELMEGEVG